MRGTGDRGRVMSRAGFSGRRRRVRWARTALPVVVLAAGLALVPSPAAAATPGPVTLASHIPSSTVTTANGASPTVRTSADGAYVVFLSSATNLVSGQIDANSSAEFTTDVFLYSRATGAVTLVSHIPGSATTTGNGGSFNPVISADGSFVAFSSDAGDLAAGQIDENNFGDVFLYSRATGVVTLVSHVPASASTTGDRPSFSPSISADGGFVAFASQANRLVAGQIDNNYFADSRDDTFLYSRATGEVTLVSHIPTSTVTTGNGGGSGQWISADGMFVVFQSQAADLVTGQIDVAGVGGDDVFLYSRATGAVTLISHRSAGVTTAAGGSRPSISADGAFVSFSSSATDIVAGQTDIGDYSTEVFLYARATGVVTLVSHIPGNATTTANDSSNESIISANGAYVAFTSSATNLVAGQVDIEFSTDVFLYERATGGVALVTHSATSPTKAVYGRAPSISADGAFLAFTSGGHQRGRRSSRRRRRQ